MKIIENPILKKVILEKNHSFFKKMLKAVVDIEKKIVAIDAEMHADLENLLIEKGSDQKDLWGINLYLEKKDIEIEYISLINIRPAQNNMGMKIKSIKIRNRIKQIISSCIN